MNATATPHGNANRSAKRAASKRSALHTTRAAAAAGTRTPTTMSSKARLMGLLRRGLFADGDFQIDFVLDLAGAKVHAELRALDAEVAIEGETARRNRDGGG